MVVSDWGREVVIGLSSWIKSSVCQIKGKIKDGNGVVGEGDLGGVSVVDDLEVLDDVIATSHSRTRGWLDIDKVAVDEGAGGQVQPEYLDATFVGTNGEWCRLREVTADVLHVDDAGRHLTTEVVVGYGHWALSILSANSTIWLRSGLWSRHNFWSSISLRVAM